MGEILTSEILLLLTSNFGSSEHSIDVRSSQKLTQIIFALKSFIFTEEKKNGEANKADEANKESYRILYFVFC